MSPYEISVLLWYHSHCEDHPDLERNPPVWRGTVQGFLANGMLMEPDRNDVRKDMCYGPTDRLHAYVDAICGVPFPRKAWIVDWPTEPKA